MTRRLLFSLPFVGALARRFKSKGVSGIIASCPSISGRRNLSAGDSISLSLTGQPMPPLFANVELVKEDGSRAVAILGPWSPTAGSSYVWHAQSDMRIESVKVAGREVVTGCALDKLTGAA